METELVSRTTRQSDAGTEIGFEFIDILAEQVDSGIDTGQAGTGTDIETCERRGIRSTTRIRIE